jgi:hypothetical protein
MSDTKHENKTPSEELSEIVVSQLVDSGLMLEADGKSAIREMSAGNLKGEDWRLLIEKAIDKEVEDEQ